MEEVSKIGRKMCGKDAPMWILLTRWAMNNGFENCQWCGATEGLTFDHILPDTFGGTRERHNLAILCGDCNVKKDCNFYDGIKPVEWPNPAFPQTRAKGLTPGTITVYGKVVSTRRFSTPKNKNLVEITLTGESIVSTMRKKKISSVIVREPDEIVLLDPRSHNGCAYD